MNIEKELFQLYLMKEKILKKIEYQNTIIKKLEKDKKKVKKQKKIKKKFKKELKSIKEKYKKLQEKFKKLNKKNIKK